MSSSLDCLDLCRLCLIKDRVSVPIFEDEGDVRQIFLKITACLPVKVSRDDKLPKKICDDCVYKVELFYQFWNTTANAEKQLLQWLGEVDLEDKQTYVTEVLDTNVMKQEQNSDNRLEGNVIQVSGHQNNMDIGMIEDMTIMTIPAGSEQQFTTVPMDTSGTVQTVQAVPGPSTHDQMGQSQTHLVTEEVEESEEEENSDDGCDNEEGLPVKEETEEVQTETFVNVPISCDEAGPSGLQQQKVTEMSEMSMTQTATDGDPKTGSISTSSRKKSSGRGIFIFERESVVMRKWQILEFDGKPYYAFIPEDDEPIKQEIIPELPEDIDLIPENQVSDNDEDKDSINFMLNNNKNIMKEKQDDQVEAVSISIDNSLDDQDDYLEDYEDEESSESPDVKPIIINGKVVTQSNTKEMTETKPPIGDLYQLKVQAGMVMLEKLEVTPSTANEDVEHVNEENLEDESGDLEVLGSIQDEDEEDQSLNEIQEIDIQEIQEENTQTNKGANISSGALKCKVCSETFESTVAFKKHVAWTHKRKVCVQENGIYICSVCDYRTQKKSLFAAHLQNKHETWSRKRQSSATLFPCDACGFVCRSKHSLQSHFIRKHTDRYEHQCKFCSKKFKVKGDLTNHIRFHHKEKPVNCDVCGKLCMNSGSLYVHQKWAHYKPKFECPICKRRMVTQENLDQHMVMQHEKREKIVCAECGKTFTKKDSFKRHMAVHTGNKPYNCVICAKPFARRSQLRQHLLIHTGKRPFVCDICGKAFTQKPGLICHRKTHPGTHPPLPVMPIGDIVKEFTEGYLSGNASGKSKDNIEEQDDIDEEDDEEEDEEEEYDEDFEQEIIEEEVLGDEIANDKTE